MIRLERIEKTFASADGRTVSAVRGIDLDVARGELVCLIGPSGCGKTTTLRMVNRLEEPSGGRVLVDGVDAASLDVIQLRRGMGFVIQRGGLFPHMTVEANVSLLCELAGASRHAARARSHELLARVQLEPARFAARFPAELSGGQRQRVGVARALALDPEILLMDEPFGALDPVTRAELGAQVRELVVAGGKTCLLVTHDIEEAFRLGDRVAALEDGQLVQVGTLADYEEDCRSEGVRRHLEVRGVR